ncbi:hypothetical protein C8Q75DRAFT_752163 [Abortiporus biennis]|nr:hypothetical protein C8Q75DRAFT_752163 [Abortiporus biennis]
MPMHPSILSVLMIFVLYSLCQCQVTATPISARLDYYAVPESSHLNPSYKAPHVTFEKNYVLHSKPSLLRRVGPKKRPEHGTNGHMPPDPGFGF